MNNETMVAVEAVEMVRSFEDANKKLAENVMLDEINDVMASIERRMKEIKIMQKVAVMLHGVDLSCVNYVSVDSYYCGTDTIRFSLKDEMKDYKLAVVLARKLGVKFEKEKDYIMGDSLQAHATVDGIKFIVAGYVPSTCHIEEKEIPLTEDEYQQRLAQVKKVRIERTIVCK